MAIKKLREWLLPIMFLLGYLFAWGMILVDRQMVVSEQAELMRQLEQVRNEMRLRELVDDFGEDWQEMVIWNKEAIVPAEEVPSGQVDK